MNTKLHLLGIVTLASLVLATTGGAAYAEVTPEGELDYANSEVKVKIKVPNINGTETLAFDDVPANFDFGFHEIVSGQQTVKSKIELADSKISVYKDYARDDKWEVTATVSDLSDGENAYEVSSFQLNGNEVGKVGSGTTILESQTDNNGIGTYSYKINNAEIDFKLPGNVGEGISQLKGNVYYTLSVTEAAE